MRFWVDDKPNAACCLFATDDELETDPDAYVCDGCAVWDALDGLWPVNRQAWAMYRSVMTRFAYDTGCVPLALGQAMAGMDAEASDDLFTRLAIIYDEVNPVKVSNDGA